MWYEWISRTMPLQFVTQLEVDVSQNLSGYEVWRNSLHNITTHLLTHLFKERFFWASNFQSFWWSYYISVFGHILIFFIDDFQLLPYNSNWVLSGDCGILWVLEPAGKKRPEQTFMWGGPLLVIFQVCHSFQRHEQDSRKHQSLTSKLYDNIWGLLQSSPS